jgi:beta-lactamase regulating signal transducer with metallopeptidase domain
MPIGDWQFWVVTLIALLALFALFRMFVPKKKGKRTSLTVSAKRHDQNTSSSESTSESSS